MRKFDLNGVWDIVAVSPKGEEMKISGTVPGCGLNDILNRDGEDPFWRDNAEKYQKYEEYSWRYTKKFNLDNLTCDMKLVFERLDTYCDVYLNGKHLADCENGNIRYSFDVTKILKEGENEILIIFYSPILRIAGKKEFEACFTTERIHTRRPQCTYGWDWTMRFVTAGISRDAYIEMNEEPVAVESAYVYTKYIDEECAVIGVDVDFIKENAGKVYDFEIIDNENNVVKAYSKYCNEDLVKMELTIAEPKLWYPVGYGEQNLYKFVIKQAGKELYETPFGIRMAIITEVEDKEGTENYNKCLEIKKTPFSQEYDKNSKFASFILKVNGVKIMCKGFNWVPCTPFPMGNTDKKITETLELAVKAGVNMVRVWGGAAFETEHFYDECSRLGLMVTQDFLMACGEYPEKEQWFIKHLRTEAEYASKLLRNKACLMWWSGDNENAILGCDTDTDYRGRSSMYEGMADIVYKNDYNRRFLASSPYGGEMYASNTFGTTHNTQYLSYFYDYVADTDMHDYKEYINLYNARFIAEEPCLGATLYHDISKFMTDEDIFGDDTSMWFYHTKNNPALKKEIMDYGFDFASKVLGEFKDGKDRYFKLKYMQYEWTRVSIERARRAKWFCSGLIFWMLNDCWPSATGWTIIDYYNKPKAGFYSFKRGAQPVLASLTVENGEFKLYISNDSREEKKLTVKLWSLKNGKLNTICEKDVLAKENCSFIAESFKYDLDNNEILIGDVIEENGKFSRCFFKNNNLEIAPVSGTVSVIEKTDSYIKLKSDSYVHVVELDGDAVYEDNYFSMLPGEERTISLENLEGDYSVNCYTIENL